MPRSASGPPVAESASAASHSARAGQVHGAVTIDRVAPSDLDDRAGVQAARPGGHVVALLVPTAGGVEVPHPSAVTSQIEAAEDRHDDHALHRGGKVAPHHHRQLVRLALEAERGSFDLLVVLELELEQPDHLDGRAGRSGDGDAAVPVGLRRACPSSGGRSGCPPWLGGRPPSRHRCRTAVPHRWWHAGSTARASGRRRRRSEVGQPEVEGSGRARHAGGVRESWNRGRHQR